MHTPSSGPSPTGPVQLSTARRPLLAFTYAVPIGTLGGLIGLGGAEFRLPVLAGPLGYSARQAVPLNLAVSLITVTASLIIRGGTLSLSPLLPFVPVILAITTGAVAAAFVGTSLVGRISNARLEQVILVLLVTIGGALIVEAFLPQNVPALVPADTIWRIGTGVLFGTAIGLVSSLLGVAGGELIIPTLLFGYGVDIKTAGTASLLISLPTVLTGVVRYVRQGALRERTDVTQTVAPMGIGSVIGAIVGGLLVGVVAPSILKLILGVILLVSAIRTFYHVRQRAASPVTE